MRDSNSPRLNRLIQTSMLGATAFVNRAVAAKSNAPCSTAVRVLDPTGTPIAGAQVSLQQQQKGAAVYKGVTDAGGQFTAPLDEGRYVLEVDSPGFQRYTDHDLVSDCKTDSPVPIEVTLQLGGLMGEVVVVNPEPNPVRRAWLNFKYLILRTLRAV